MNKFYFNTGVRPSNISNFPYEYHKKTGSEIINGVLMNVFHCDAPINSTLMFLSSNPEMSESKAENVGVFEITSDSIISKYAYFRLNSK